MLGDLKRQNKTFSQSGILILYKQWDFLLSPCLHKTYFENLKDKEYYISKTKTVGFLE